MTDRRIVTDIGLALLIALPSALPAAPSPWNSDEEVGKVDSPAVEAPADTEQWVESVAAGPETGTRYGRS
ncbi:MAG TPA: hypothetical protein VFU80_08550 [Sphingomicrobium sp.]|nr:hypothetical protein [Sphingomicrobium sp.]